MNTSEIGQQFIDWLEANRKAHDLFQEYFEMVADNRNDPPATKAEYLIAFEKQREASTARKEAQELYDSLIEAVDLHLTRLQTEVKLGKTA